MECKFQVGDKVVCIEETVIPKDGIIGNYPLTPRVGGVYQIREILIGCLSKKPCLRFHEIPDEDVTFICDGEVMEGIPALEASAFRPLVTRKTDIRVFRAMLTKQKVGVPA